MDPANNFKELGNKEYQARNFIRAIEYYTQAINLKPDAIYFTNRAACNIELKKFERAIEDSARAIEADRTYVKGYFRGSQAYTHIGKLDEAYDLIKRGIEQNPNEQQIRREYDNLQILIAYKASLDKHLQEGEHSDALRKLNALLERCDADSTLVDLKVDVLCLSNDVKTAKTFINEKEASLMKIKQECFYINSAKIARFSNDLLQAKVSLQRALALEPDSTTLKKALIHVRAMEDMKKRATDTFTAKKYEEAIGLYDEAANLDPQNRTWKSVMLSNKASCFMQLKKNKEALEIMKQSTDLDPENAKFLYKRGKLEKDLNDWESAETSMRKAKTLDPSLTIDNDLKEVSKKVKELNKKDYYAILGVDKKATTEEIKKAYKELVKKWHPDKHAGDKDLQDKAEKKFKEISEAFNVISVPEKRKRYDMGGMDADNESFNGFGNMSDLFGRGGGADPLIQMFFNSGSRNTFSFGGSGGGAGGRGNTGRNPFSFHDMFSHGESEDPFQHARRR